MILPLLLLVPLLPLQRAAAPLLKQGAAVLVLDVASGAELMSAGPVDQALPPGSVFKLVTALAAAGAPAVRGTLSCPAPRPDFAAVRCPGSDGHGPLTLERALAQSCNGYFAQLGAAVGPAALIATAAALGLGQGAGRLPDRADAAAAIGTHGGGARLSARQQAQLLRAVARGALASGAPLPGQALLPRVRDGLRRAVIEGTAQGVAGPAEKVAIAGKTGTAVAGAGKIGWFAGYAPAADPSVVIVVGQRGITGREAAQAARALFSAYFYGRAPNPR